MISKKEFLEVINKYSLDLTGIPRDKYLDMLQSSLERKEILILKGIRRCGKSTILKQLIQVLVRKGVSKDSILYINFDDYRFLPHLDLNFLDFILEQIPKGKKGYLFLDEIQKIPEFEIWLRSQYERGVDVKFVISGSTSTLISKDHATLLTGRNLTFEIFPLDYREFKTFSDGGFDEFLTYGGFPEVVLAGSEVDKMNLLKNYVSDIVTKDILGNHSIQDVSQFMHFSQFILSNPGVRISINRLSSQLDISKDTVKRYLYYMKDAYLIFEVPFFSYSAKSKFIVSNVPKYYVLDNGFYLVNSLRKENGKLVEAAIAQRLFRSGNDLYYWKEKNEVDFVCKDTAYNVVTSRTIPERELRGLQDIKKMKKHVKRLVILNECKEEQGLIEYALINDFLSE